MEPNGLQHACCIQTRSTRTRTRMAKVTKLKGFQNRCNTYIHKVTNYTYIYIGNYRYVSTVGALRTVNVLSNVLSKVS